jgi:succinyl-CoA synthetase beta subunit
MVDAFEEEMNAWSASSHQGQAHVADLGGKLILPMLFGGGASTIVIETLAQAGGDPMFLSDFGGNPPYERMKKTAEICLRHKLADASLLLILGGQANNTQIDVTFSAIADALQEWVDDNGPHPIPVVIGRGGPGLVQGFAVMKKTLENLGMPYVFFGPDTPITLVASYAARLAKQCAKANGGAK